jgi:hypothetical protein
LRQNAWNIVTGVTARGAESWLTKINHIGFMPGDTMRYVITESADPKEVDHFFETDTTPRIGQAILRGGRSYEVIDIEIHPSPKDEDQMVVRAALRRVI